MAFGFSRWVVAFALLFALCGFASASINGSVNVTAPANSSTVSGNVSIALTLPAGLVNVTVSLLGVGVLNQTNNTATALNITWRTGLYPNGPYNLTIFISNSSNATDNATMVLNLTIDNTPAISFNVTAPSNASTVHENVSINLTLPAGLVNVTMSITGGEAFNQTDNVAATFNATWETRTYPPDGSHSITIFVVNASNAAGNATITLNLTVDNSAPYFSGVTSNGTGNATRLNSTLTVTVNVTDASNTTMNVSNASSRAMQPLSGSLYRYTGNASDLGCQSNSACLLTITATDFVGNTNATAFSITVDDTAPNITNATVSSVSSDDATVSVEADESVLFTIRYGTVSATLSSTDTSSSYSGGASFDLNDLDAGTVYFFNLTACDAAGNCVTNGTNQFTTSTFSGGSAGGGGGGSAGEYAPPSTTVEASASRVWGEVPAGAFEYNVTNNVSFEKIDLVFNQTAARVKLTVTQHKSKPGDVPPLDGPAVYKYLRIDHEGLTGSVASYRVSFRVPVSWLSSEGIGTDLISLYRLESGTWVAYGATPGRAVDGGQEFTVTVPGFSSFAIGASEREPAAVTPVEQPQETAPEPVAPEPVSGSLGPAAPTTEQPATITSTTGPKRGTPWLMSALLLVGVLALLAVGGTIGVKRYRSAKARAGERGQQLELERTELERTRHEHNAPRVAHDDAARAQNLAIAQAADLREHPVFQHPAYHTHVAALREYIRAARAKGVPDEAIAKRIGAAGWNRLVIEHELGHLTQKGGSHA